MRTCFAFAPPRTALLTHTLSAACLRQHRQHASSLALWCPETLSMAETFCNPTASECRSGTGKQITQFGFYGYLERFGTFGKVTKKWV